VVVTFDGSWMRLYVNGAEVEATPTTNSLLDSMVLFTVGAKAAGGGNWAGTIDEPAVYSSALSANTVSQHYLAGS